MPLSNLSLLIFNPINKQCKVRNTSDVPTNALVNPSEITIKLAGRIQGPDLSYFVNKNTFTTPLIANMNAATVTSPNFDLPLDQEGKVVQGSYALNTKLIAQTNGAQPVVTNAVSSPGVNGEGYFIIAGRNWTQVLAVGESFTIAGGSTTVNNGVKTVTFIEFVGSETRVWCSEAVTTLLMNKTISFTQNLLEETIEYDYFCKDLCLKTSAKADCYSTRYGSLLLKDKSAYTGFTISNKEWKVYPPAGLTNPVPTSPMIFTTNNVNILQISTGQWTYDFSVDATYTQDDGLVVEFTETISDKIIIACYDICSVRKCYDALLDAHLQFTNNVVGAPSNYSQYLTQANFLITGASAAMNCGDYTKYQYYMTQLEKVLESSGCKCDCGCGGENGPQWIDNMSNDPNASLQSIVESLQISIWSIEGQLQELGGSILFQSFLAELIELQALLNTEQQDIQAVVNAALALNPNSPTWADDLAEVQALYPTVDLTSLLAQLDTIQAMYLEIQEAYPLDPGYYTAGQNAIDSIGTSINTTQTNWLALQALIDALEPSNYLDTIADIQDQIEALYEALNTIYVNLNVLNTTVSNYGTVIDYLIEQLANQQQQIWNLTLPTQVIGSKIQPLYADVNVSNAYPQSPAKYLAKGGYLKFVIKGQDPTPAGTVVTLKRIGLPAPDYTIYSKTVNGSTYEIEIILIPDLTVDPVVFKAGGMIDLNNTQEKISVAGINSTTEIAYDQGAAFSIESNSISNVFNSIEVYGYDLTWN